MVYIEFEEKGDNNDRERLEKAVIKQLLDEVEHELSADNTDTRF